MTEPTTQPDAVEGIDTPAEPLEDDEGTVDEPTEDVTDEGEEEPEAEGEGFQPAEYPRQG